MRNVERLLIVYRIGMMDFCMHWRHEYVAAHSIVVIVSSFVQEKFPAKQPRREKKKMTPEIRR
jgi:hypothetical protein